MYNLNYTDSTMSAISCGETVVSAIQILGSTFADVLMQWALQPANGLQLGPKIYLSWLCFHFLYDYMMNTTNSSLHIVLDTLAAFAYYISVIRECGSTLYVGMGHVLLSLYIGIETKSRNMLKIAETRLCRVIYKTLTL